LVKVAMLGSGYAGLVSGACFAELGASVTCVDVDAAKIAQLNAGHAPIYEPGLEELVRRNAAAGRLRFSGSYAETIPDSDLVFIAVGTPSRRGDGHADLSYVYQAARQIAPLLKGYTVIVDKSTVPVGTARNVYRTIREANPDADFDVASNPEFLKEGAAIADFMSPDRVVIGVENVRARALLQELYKPLEAKAPIIITDLESAELIKYASNAFLATKISFINEISALCEAVGADVQAVSKGMGLDARIGPKFLQPGPGFGGSCLPKDTRALAYAAQEHGVPARIVETVIEVNEAQKARMIGKVRAALGGSARGRTLAVLGLTFKPETDDMREAPSLVILLKLIEDGAVIRAHDPKGMEEAKALLPPEIVYCDDAYAAMDGADAVILMTDWAAYRDLDLAKVRSRVAGRVFIDLRNMHEPAKVHAAGFDYVSVGRRILR
jgi:UDPglucose 6-dehydrogenase